MREKKERGNEKRSKSETERAIEKVMTSEGLVIALFYNIDFFLSFLAVLLQTVTMRKGPSTHLLNSPPTYVTPFE